MAGSVVVESFFVVEYEYGGSPGWNYAPQVVVSSPAGGSGVYADLSNLSVPGVGTVSGPATCRRVASGARVSLVDEVYGDYEFSMSNSGNRASGGEATIVLSAVDGLGTINRLTLRGPIVPGALPSTYSGGPSRDSLCR